MPRGTDSRRGTRSARARGPRPRRSRATLRFPGRVVKVGDANRSLVLAVQRRLNDLGCGTIAEDGIFGSDTASAVKLFQARFPDAEGLPLKVDGLLGAITWAALFGRESVPTFNSTSNALLAGALEIAASQIGVVEEPPGSNRGPEIDKYLRGVGIDPARGCYPWCAAFVHYCFTVAARRIGRPNPVIKTAGVLDHWRRAVDSGIPTISAAKAHLNEGLVRPGHVFIIDTGAAGGAGHTGLVERVVAGKLVTIEGNTNDVGAREGVGVFRRLGRRVREVDVGFIDYGRVRR